MTTTDPDHTDTTRQLAAKVCRLLSASVQTGDTHTAIAVVDTIARHRAATELTEAADSVLASGFETLHARELEKWLRDRAAALRDHP